MTDVHRSDDTYDRLIDEDNFPVFKNTFDEKTRRELVGEDLFASRSVVGILVALILLGVGIAGIALLLAPAF